MSFELDVREFGIKLDDVDPAVSVYIGRESVAPSPVRFKTFYVDIGKEDRIFIAVIGKTLALGNDLSVLGYNVVSCKNKVLSRLAKPCIAINISSHELCALHLDQVSPVLCLADDLIRTGQIEYYLSAVLYIVSRRA